MAENTPIEWCDFTFNGWEGCTEVGPGCDNCYAKARDIRFKNGNWGEGAPRRRTSEGNWQMPIRWNKRPYRECGKCGHRGSDYSKTSDKYYETYYCCARCGSADTHETRARVFCASLADVFDNAVDPMWRCNLFDLIDRTPNLDWLLLTKRIGNAAGALEAATTNARKKAGTPWHNIWLGATIVNQEEADRDIQKLLAVPAKVRFLSMEPLLGPVTLNHVHFHGEIEIDVLNGTHGISRPHDGTNRKLDWVIGGGENGPRPMEPDWIRSLRDQCKAAGVPFLFKQWGTHDSAGLKVGKKKAGRILDGVTHTEYPA